MPGWYYDKKELHRTPSIRNGVNYKTECRYRKEGAKFIFDAGTRLGVGYNTMATGVVYFHRFYMIHSFTEFPRYITASACIFLAGKVEETPKLYEHIIEAVSTLLDEKELRKFGRNPKNAILSLERILLQTIKFDLIVKHPNNYVPRYAKYLKGSRKQIEKVVQSAWNFASDSLYTTLALQWEPQIIAIAFMYLAGKLSKVKLVDKKDRFRWWDNFVEGLSVKLLDDICHQLLDSYAQAQEAQATASVPVSSSAADSGRDSAAMLPKDEALPVTNGISQTDLTTSKQTLASLPQFIGALPPPPTAMRLLPKLQTGGNSSIF